MADRRTVFLSIFVVMLAYGVFRIWIGWSTPETWAPHFVSFLQGSAFALIAHWGWTR